jgi:hypothetical protein
MCAVTRRSRHVASHPTCIRARAHGLQGGWNARWFWTRASWTCMRAYVLPHTLYTTERHTLLPLYFGLVEKRFVNDGSSQLLEDACRRCTWTSNVAGFVFKVVVSCRVSPPAHVQCALMGKGVYSCRPATY